MSMTMPCLDEAFADLDQWYRPYMLNYVDWPAVRELERTLDTQWRACDGVPLAEDRAPLDAVLRRTATQLRGLYYRAAQAVV